MEPDDNIERLEAFVFGSGDTASERKTEEVNQEMAKDERKDKSKPLPKDRIKCVKCGGIFAQRPDVREKRIDAFGSAKKLEDNYLCRGCRKGKKFNGKEWVAEEKKVKPAKKEKKK